MTREKQIQGDFSFIPILCNCHCNNVIPLNKDRVVIYEKYGYPKFIRGHNSSLRCFNKLMGDFEFIPRFCKHCGIPINLKKERFRSYEEYGYPEYLQGHKTESNIIISSDLFCFIPYKCKHCDKYIKLNTKMIWWYEHSSYPEYIHRHNPMTKETKERIKISTNIAIKNPEVKKRRYEAQMKGHTPEANIKRSISMKSVWSDPEYHERLLDILDTPELREKIIKSALITWSKPEIRAKVSKENNGHWQPDRDELKRKQKASFKKFGWYPLNPIIGNGRKIIKGYERHHVNFNDVIYVPKDYNQDIIHRLVSDFNMEIVNTMAYFFLVMNYIEDLNKLFKEVK